MLGLSTQVPSVWQYVSDGPYREYSIGSCLLKFKHISNKDITGISYKSALVIQALKALGEHNITNDMIKKLKKALSENEKTAFPEEAQFGTAWIFEIVKAICRQEM